MHLLNYSESKVLNDEARARAGGSFISLPDGYTHYELGGNETDRPVVLVHGFSVPYFIFDPTFEFLARSGFHVLRFDLFGRGFSDRPNARYNLDFFIKQLSDLLDALRLSRPVSLIGLSMGGPIASAFTVLHPERVHKLVLIDPAGVRSVTLTPMLRMVKLPLVAEVVFSLVGSERLIQSAAKDFFDPKLVDHFIARYRVQTQYQGFQRAILSTIRNGMFDSFIHTYEALGKMDTAVLLLWGREDMTVPFEHSRELCAAIPQAEFHAVANTGHIPHYEKPGEVNPVLLEFLRRA